MSSEEELCQICKTAEYKYTCPRCDITYCSVACYKSQEHLKCSEAFYKQCIQDELAAKANEKANNKEDMRKIYDILRRIRESDAGFDPEDFDKDSLDSEGEDNEEYDENGDDDEDQAAAGDFVEDADDLDISERLKDIDINNANEVWANLNADEKEEFKKLLASGEIMKLMPDYKPWWEKKKEKSKIVVLPEKKDLADETPEIVQNIPKFSSICSKEPAPCIHYNLWNILGSYACMSRYFNGEHMTSANEATAFLVNLSSCLKYGTNFEDVEDAIVSVEMEAITTGNGASQLLPNGMPSTLLVESREQLQNDVRALMSSRYNKLAALSDTLRMLQATKQMLRKANKKDTEFQKLFALSSGMEELTKTKVQQLAKKMEFYLSYVNRDAENDMK